MANLLSEDGIRLVQAEIDECKQIIDDSIQRIKELPGTLGIPDDIDPNEIRDGHGRLMMAELVSTKAQLILAEVMLLKE